MAISAQPLETVYGSLREGIAKAKSEGRYKGRKPIDDQRRNSVFKLAAEGSTRAVIAKQLGIGEATV